MTLELVKRPLMILRPNLELRVGDQVQMTSIGLFLFDHKEEDAPEGTIEKIDEDLVWIRFGPKQNLRPYHSGFWQRI